MWVLLAIDLNGANLPAVFMSGYPGGGHHHLIEVYNPETICVTSLHHLPCYWNLKMNPRKLLIAQYLGDLDFLLPDHVLTVDLCQLCVAQLLLWKCMHEISSPLLQRISDLSIQCILTNNMINVLLAERCLLFKNSWFWNSFWWLINRTL